MLESVGDFQVIREIGRGGMGVVYEAVQESLGRHVALKVLPRHSQLNRSQQERFRRESRSAAQLHHSNIVPVFAVGEDQGMLFYAMQFIEGAGLDLVIDELNRLRSGRQTTQQVDAVGQATAVAKSLPPLAMVPASGDHSYPKPPNTPDDGQSRHIEPPSELAASATSSAEITLPGQHRRDGSSHSGSGEQYWHSVARIGVQIAGALDYAHAQGVLHRDIKPSNLLLDQTATVWLTDFGLAKSLDNDDLTQTGEWVGTLRYLPPEQL